MEAPCNILNRIATIDIKRVQPGVKIIQGKGKIDENELLLKVLLYQSRSYAASFVIGGNANGLIE